jgi:hypothetical protein
MSKYTHRIGVKAYIGFDLESDYETPTQQEVEDFISRWGLVDGHTVDRDSGFVLFADADGVKRFVSVLIAGPNEIRNDKETDQ